MSIPFGSTEKAVGNTNAAQLTVQPGGLFAVPGAERNLISTFLTPTGILAKLPAMPTTLKDPLYGFWTGVGAESGSETDYPCSDSPTALMYGGYITRVFGQIQRDTPTIEPTALIEQARGVLGDINVLGNVFASHPLITRGGVRTPTQIDLALAAAMMIVGTNIYRKMCKMVWTGNPANNSSNGGYKEFNGFDRLIKTGHVDFTTSTAMAAADSLIVDYGYTDVTDTGKDPVAYLSSVVHYLEHLAERTGMSPVTWTIVMRPELFHFLTSLWACRYLTDRCGTLSGDNPIVLNDEIAVRMRDEMRNGMFLTINGKRWNVTLDDGIRELTSSDNGSVPVGKYSSSIYFVPLTVMGNFTSAYLEYMDYSKLAAQLSPMGIDASKYDFWTEGGTMIWALEQVKYCFKASGRIAPTLVLRTPQLAARIQNVVYDDLLIPLRDTFPGEANWVAGGVASR